jgi:3-hydroxyisobutyrate dehydrogenase-like beta-hydroxyacid dehydrogenase
MRVGFVGLGTMGSRIVRRLLSAGHVPVVYDSLAEARERLAEAGAVPANSVADVAARADVVFSSVPMPADVEGIYTGHQGALEEIRPGHVFVDLSTIDPTTARRVAAIVQSRGGAFLDAPVSGGPTGADAGTLAIMVGGDVDALARARPLLDTFSARVLHVGPVGAGSVVKLANQLLVGANTIAAMEAMAFARQAGIEPSVVLDAISASAGDSFMLRRSIRDFVLTGDFSPQFALRLLVKDLRLYAGEARTLGATTPSGDPTLALFEQALVAGLGAEDYAAIVKLIEPQGDEARGNL